MKHKRGFFWLLLCLFLFLSGSLQAQPCDTCSTAWGPDQFVEYHNILVPSLPGCTLSMFITYKTRICNGQVQFQVTSQTLVNTSSSGCLLTCWDADKLVLQGIKQIVLDMGVPVINYRPAACYASVEVDSPTTLKSCFGAEWSTIPQWTVSLPCDSSGCCLTQMTPDPVTGQVLEETILAVDCPPTATPNIPAMVEIKCMKGGVWYSEWVHVLPGQNPVCLAVCKATGSSVWRKGMVSAVRHTPELALGPNPVEDQLHVKYELSDESAVRFILVNTNGQIVRDVALHGAKGELDLDVSNLPAGAYVGNIFTSDKVFTSNSVLIKR